ncbi:procollagen-lysine,2-oxoglutarate 5-dioxygenase isoform X1 [Neodiprion lecontei]|uniref:procollagen-lysine 5-dioxygenase n=2 Tax=Neodiprion lecontei TaxID=441921 RepID=A0ABM3FZN2_NEOLC|nr:procollagen-lysine,2-oxoglutarate 5-dioxygenase isoform X1 [Neodiprion lecontei]
MGETVRKIFQPTNCRCNLSAYFSLCFLLLGFAVSWVNGKDPEVYTDACAIKVQRSRNMYLSNYSEHPGCECDISSKIAAQMYTQNQRCRSTADVDVNDVLVFTVATNETDGYKRYIRSAVVNGFRDKIHVLGLGETWKGGDVHRTVGGGFKVNLFKEQLRPYKDDKDKIILFTDGYDVIFLSSLEAIVEKFRTFGARVLFSAEEYCWPDKSAESRYPSVGRGKRYLNSGGFIGYASDIYAILTSSKLSDGDDDQRFYTELYLDRDFREKHQMKLDHRSEIFQNLFGGVADVELRFKGNDAYLQNVAYNTVPLILHGNGRSKLVLNALGNYLANAWSPEEGCLNCWDEMIELDKAKVENYPVIMISIFLANPTPFLEEFLEKIYKQAYPKSKLHLFIYNNVPYHSELINEFVESYAHEYKSVKQILPQDDISEVRARDFAFEHCLLKKCSGLLSIDSEAHLDNQNALKLLVEQQRGIVAPLLVRPYKAWSNFWGALTDDGFYARSSDYMEIVQNERRGLWNVPFVSNCYLINASLINNKETRPSYSVGDLDVSMSFAYSNREKDIFMYVSNRVEFGHLVSPDNFDTKLTNPDLYQIFDNKLDWQKRYIHENYTENFNPNKTPIQPCPDVFWFPIVTTRFTKELIEIMEAFGQWSDGTNSDPRLSGGYENVPTRDIHTNQVNLEPQWLYFLKEYVRPLQELAFTGYFHDPPRSLMNFMVRYRPDEQPSLRPHHDSSTYTINIALNRAGIDYEGGGCRFIRYNCSVTDTKPGWMLMHPGRLTHYHEGLLVTKGTRYIMISFVDP